MKLSLSILLAVMFAFTSFEFLKADKTEYTFDVQKGMIIAEKGRRAGRRQRNQVGRIKQGVKSGELTKREARGLARGQKRIRDKRQEFAADGEMTRKEKGRLERMQDRQSGRIWRKKHNDRERGSQDERDPASAYDFDDDADLGNVVEPPVEDINFED